MRILDKLYSIFLCLTKEDGMGDRHKRAVSFLEMVSTFFLSSLTMLVFGLCNLKIANQMLWLVIIGLQGLISYFFLNSYFIKSKRYVEIVKYTIEYEKKKKVLLAFIAVLVVLSSFVLLICSGILMSYLYSLQG